MNADETTELKDDSKQYQTFKSDSELVSAFNSGEFKFVDSFNMLNVEFNRTKVNNVSLISSLKNKSNIYVAYMAESSDTNNAEDVISYVVFVWSIDDKFNMTKHEPVLLKKSDMSINMDGDDESNDNVVISGDSHTSDDVGESQDSDNAKIDKSRPVVGDKVICKFNLPSGDVGVITSKIDTGADMSSIHADDIKLIRHTDGANMVSFKNMELSDTPIVTKLVSKVPVQTADGGVEYRPIVSFDLEVRDKKISGAEFNLNDRSSMSSKCIIGRNILDKAKFIIDTTIKSGSDNNNTNVSESDETQLHNFMIALDLSDPTPKEDSVPNINTNIKDVNDSPNVVDNDDSLESCKERLYTSSEVRDMIKRIIDTLV